MFAFCEKINSRYGHLHMGTSGTDVCTEQNNSTGQMDSYMPGPCHSKETFVGLCFSFWSVLTCGSSEMLGPSHVLTLTRHYDIIVNNIFSCK